MAEERGAGADGPSGLQTFAAALDEGSRAGPPPGAGDAAAFPSPARRWRPERWVPVLYALLAATWILLSDLVLAALVRSPAALAAVSVVKGFAFVLVTAVLLHLLLRRAARRSEDRFRALIDRSTDMILVVDAGARFRFWSPSATETLGWTAQAAVGRPMREIVHPEDRPLLDKTYSLLVAQPGATAHITTRCRHKDGSWRLVEAVGRNMLQDAAVQGVVVNARDVTEKRRLEEQLRQAQKLESVGQLAGGVAHDFNNLLTVILSCAEAAREDVAAGASPRLDDLEEIHAAGQRAADLTRQLLAFASRQVIAPVPLDLNAAVRSAEKLLRRLLGEDVELVADLQPGLWSVRCDPGQIEQVLVNLAVNARDAMPRGGRLVLETRNEGAAEAGAGEWVRLVVRDSGTGMSPEVKAHLFEPFFTTKARGRGTGLGLATVYGIVKQNDGHIGVESEPGRGTTFDVRLPRAADAVRAAPAPARPAASTGGTETVLVVEDDPLVRAVTVRSLESGGYRVLVAENGHRALEIAAGERPHLLVTDVVMPGLDGRTVADALRLRHPELRVLYVSGYPQDAVARRGVLDSDVELLAKPFTSESLLARIRQVLDGSRPRAEA